MPELETPVLETPEAEPAKTTDNQTEVVSPEPEKTTDNQETQEAVAKEVTPQYYTTEELEQVKNFTELDPSRLPKPLKDALEAQRSAQSELTKMKQKESVQPQPQKQRPADPKQAFAFDVFQAAERDDYQTINNLMSGLDYSIEQRKLQMIRELDPERQALLEKGILEDIDYKNRLNNALSSTFQEKQLYGSLNNEIDSEIYKKIPDFQNVAPEIGNFAMKDLEISRDGVANVMNPRVLAKGLAEELGIPKPQAVQLAKKYVVEYTAAINKMYQLFSGKSIKGKEVKVPPKVESAGINQPQGKSGEGESLRQKAIKSGDVGDWGEYYSWKARNS